MIFSFLSFFFLPESQIEMRQDLKLLVRILVKVEI